MARLPSSDGSFVRTPVVPLALGLAILVGSFALARQPAAPAAPVVQPAEADAPPAEAAPAPEVPAADDAVDPAPATGDGTPRGPDIPGFSPPQPPHPQLKIEKELVTDEDLEWYKRNRAEFQKAVNAANITGANSELVSRGFAVLVLRLSLEENRPNLAEVRTEVERRMDSAGNFPGVKDTARRVFRAFMLDKVIENARLLVIGNENTPAGNLEVRLQAMILLNNALIEREDRGAKRPAEFYVPTYKTFLEVLVDDGQHEAVRIWAARGLKRVLDIGRELRNPDRDAIAKALMSELLSGENGAWLDMRIVETAGFIDIVRFGGDKPRVVEGLITVLNDRERDCLVRSEAAKQLGRLKVDASYNMSLFAHETAQLVLDLADQYAENPKSAKLRICFLNAYLAFVPANDAEFSKREAGFLARVKGGKVPAFQQHAAYVTAALEQVAPLVDHVVAAKVQAPIAPATVQKLDEWLQQNRPTDWKPTPDLAPLDAQRVAETPPQPAPAG